ncbi:MAG TPA: polysaccharide pyruvyl transferase family protein [Jatrophihabitans sp.]|nr:polysaccharide pyruvyl transferase family protein [Jatrophihabitans sp.]
MIADAAPVRPLLLGDIGRNAGYHVGDDAMLAGLLQAARRQGVPLAATLLAADPGTAAVRFGLPATPLFGFAELPDGQARRERLAAVTERPEQQAAGQLAAVRNCDVLIVTGGGNLSQSWPALVYERLAAARLAGRCGVPVLLTGQSIGPSFGAEVGPLVRELLARARLVAVRERVSHWLAGELGVPGDRLVLAPDDAAGLPAEPPPSAPVLAGTEFIAVTVNDLGADLAGLAEQLRHLAGRTGARLVLVPHVGDLAGEPVEDVAVARRLAGLTGGLAVNLPTPTEAVWYCRHAAVVVSSRYHPIVFAAANQVPALFLSQDGYTAMKGIGALQLAGLDGWRLPASAAAGGALLPLGLELWQRRAEVRTHLREAAPGDGFLAALLGQLATIAGGGAAQLPDLAASPAVDGPRPVGVPAGHPFTSGEVIELELAGAATALSDARDRAGRAEAYAAGLLERAESAERYAASLEGAVRRAEEYARSVELRAERAEQYATSLRQALGDLAQNGG